MVWWCGGVVVWWCAVDKLSAPEAQKLLRECIWADDQHPGREVAATEKQISREIKEVLRGVPKDQDGMIKVSDLSQADWDNSSHGFGPGTTEIVTTTLQWKGGESSVDLTALSVLWCVLWCVLCLRYGLLHQHHTTRHDTTRHDTTVK